MTEVFDAKRHALKTLTRGGYDLQKLRVVMAQRIVANYKSRLGIKQETKETESGLSKEDLKILENLRKDYQTMIKGVMQAPAKKHFVPTLLIAEYAEFVLIQQYLELEKYETEIFQHQLKNVLKDFPLWTMYLKDVFGCGPLMSAVLITEVDIRKTPRISNLWALCGLDNTVAYQNNPDGTPTPGTGRSRQSFHMVEREYKEKDTGEIKTRMGLSYTPFLKTKMAGVLMDSFMRLGRAFTEDEKKARKAAKTKEAKDAIKASGPYRSPYRKLFDDERHRLEHHWLYGVHNDGKKQIVDPKTGKVVQRPRQRKGQPFRMEDYQSSPGHRMRMARRKAIKQFLADLWVAWRKLEKLPVTESYHEGKLGHKHHGDAAD